MLMGLGAALETTKIMHFRHISAKIQLKNLKLVHYYFLAVRGNNLIRERAVPSYILARILAIQLL